MRISLPHTRQRGMLTDFKAATVFNIGRHMGSTKLSNLAFEGVNFLFYIGRIHKPSLFLIITHLV